MSMPRRMSPFFLGVANIVGSILKLTVETWPGVRDRAGHDRERASLARAHDHAIFKDLGSQAQAMARAAQFLCKVHKPSLACNRVERERIGRSKIDPIRKSPPTATLLVAGIEYSVIIVTIGRFTIRKPISFLKSGRDDRPRLRCRVEMRPGNRTGQGSSGVAEAGVSERRAQTRQATIV